MIMIMKMIMIMIIMMIMMIASPVNLVLDKVCRVEVNKVGDGVLYIIM